MIASQLLALSLHYRATGMATARAVRLAWAITADMPESDRVALASILGVAGIVL